jgi:hypothetical protein
MSSHDIQPRTENQQPLDEIDRLIRWALIDEVAGEEPSPQVWHNIQARLTACSRAIPSQPVLKRPWRQFASLLQDWALGLMAPLDANWEAKLTPRERAYLIWREHLLLSMKSTTAAAITC